MISRYAAGYLAGLSTNRFAIFARPHERPGPYIFFAQNFFRNASVAPLFLYVFVQLR